MVAMKLLQIMRCEPLLCVVEVCGCWRLLALGFSWAICEQVLKRFVMAEAQCDKRVKTDVESRSEIENRTAEVIVS